MAVVENDYSSIVSIIYFSINIIFLISLAVIVYNQGGHKIKSKSYLKDIWMQRKIYAPLIIHFYDTATDIGVVYSWYHLMGNDYDSVDMVVFFWTGVSFLAVYRFCLLCWSFYDWLCNEHGKWYHVLLVLVDLYIFVTVYDSFIKAKDIISKNAERRKNAGKNAENSTEQPHIKSDAEQEIEPDEIQFFVQLAEAISESMPQIVLQSVFVIRSANDTGLREGSNKFLIMLSVIASLLSISMKYVNVDKNHVAGTAKDLKPRQRFPDCIQSWYPVRVIWRMFHIMSRFCVFVLIWTILGGAWLPIWTGFVFTYWMTIYCAFVHEDSKDIVGNVIYATISCIGTYVEGDGDAYKQSVLLISCAFIQSVIGLGLITVFGVFSFDCGICYDSNTRRIFNYTNDNDRMLIFWTLGVVSSVMDMILFLVMRKQNVFYPLYMYLKTEMCTMITDGNSKEDFNILLDDKLQCPVYVSDKNKDKIFDNIKPGVMPFSREEYMSWVQQLTPHKLYVDIVHVIKY
eukprot:459500_1